MRLLAGAVAVALAVLPVLPATPGSSVPGSSSEPPADDGPTIELTTDNWGRAVRLDDAGAPAYAHLFTPSSSTATTVTARIHFATAQPQGFTATLSDPQATGNQPAPCVVPSAPAQAICVFDVAVGAGVNHLTLRLALPGSRTPIMARGTIIGGALQFTASLQATDAVGIWRPIPAAGDIRLPATLFTNVRYVVGNVGGVPFRVEGACDGRAVPPGSSLACGLTGVRPVASIDGVFRRQLRLTDPLGADAETLVTGNVRAAPERFRLDRSGYVVGQRVVLSASGLTDRDLGLLTVRVGSRAVRLSPESTAGRVVFAMPFAEPGATDVDVVVGGVTVGRLPVHVTSTDLPLPPAPFPVALIVLLGIGAVLLALLAWRAVGGLRYSARSGRSRTT
jgi:hypothetical protein